MNINTTFIIGLEQQNLASLETPSLSLLLPTRELGKVKSETFSQVTILPWSQISFI